MSKIKQLASQTVWYGVSSIGAKFLNYLLNPILTRILSSSSGKVEFGDISVLYACIALTNIVFTYGFETAYFRFSNDSSLSKKTLFQTAFSSLLMSTIGLCLMLFTLRYPLSRLTHQEGHAEYIVLAILIVAFDTLTAIPLARLRQENRPKRYAMVNVGGVLVCVSLTILLLGILPRYAAAHPNGFWFDFYQKHSNVELFLFANLAQAIFAFLLLSPQWFHTKIKINKPLWKKMFQYSSPMIIVGLGGQVNETMDRIFLSNFGGRTLEEAKQVVGIYSSNYKLAIVITMFITAFKMAAEPFFFSQAKSEDAPKLYAKIMKWFVIVMCIAFLSTLLYIDIWQLIEDKNYRSGLGVVPILLCANICLGIYYNQSVWYKLTDHMRIGMYITLLGASITIILNLVFIPKFGMYASAWATFICYATMMVTSYLLGHKYYPIPYNLKKIGAYIAVALILVFIQKGLSSLISNTVVHLITGTILMCLFLLLVVFAERKELMAFPVIGKYIAKIKK